MNKLRTKLRAIAEVSFCPGSAIAHRFSLEQLRLKLAMNTRCSEVLYEFECSKLLRVAYAIVVAVFLAPTHTYPTKPFNNDIMSYTSPFGMVELANERS
jgi:hypothetical protein